MSIKYENVVRQHFQWKYSQKSLLGIFLDVTLFLNMILEPLFINTYFEENLQTAASDTGNQVSLSYVFKKTSCNGERQYLQQTQNLTL